MIFNNLRLRRSAGYAYRLFKQYRRGAGAWTETEFKQQAHSYMVPLIIGLDHRLELKVTSVFNKRIYFSNGGICKLWKRLNEELERNNYWLTGCKNILKLIKQQIDNNVVKCRK